MPSRSSGRRVVLGVGGGVVVLGTDVVGDGAGVDPSVVTANSLTARPAPPTHGSNPAWMLVRYHDVWAYPRCTESP